MDDLPLSLYNTETTTLSYNNDDAVLDSAEHVNVVTRSGTDTTPVKDATINETVSGNISEEICEASQLDQCSPDVEESQVARNQLIMEQQTDPSLCPCFSLMERGKAIIICRMAY